MAQPPAVEKGGATMTLPMTEVELFAVACERLMFARTRTSMSEDERRLILYYLSEVTHTLKESPSSDPRSAIDRRREAA